MSGAGRYPIDAAAAGAGKPVRLRTRTGADGAPIAYLGRTILPLPTSLAPQSTYTIRAGDRIDNVAAAVLGDPLLYWMLLEANGLSDPAALCAVPGTKIVVPAGIGQPVAALDQPTATRNSAASAAAAQADDAEERP